MTICATLCYPVLGSYHYLKRLNYHICYADTDSLMVQNWPDNDCHAVNAYLNLNHVELKFEQRMKRDLCVLSPVHLQAHKRTIVTKGFQKRINELIEFISQLVLENVWHFMFSTPLEKVSFAWMEDHLSLSSRGWILWVYIIQEAHYKCRDAKKYSIYRKTKHLVIIVRTCCVRCACSEAWKS
ncbi:DNA polymerase [Trichonephila inaurata madagascariensis]|uniref:DNA polymerase n=1 Tax=Trichonephila inaurata madagascariensis TaxID=2747483 RepID=A0A8X7CL98_9ARAC|nr:DNA polymerase [Trichonephila inaurata madagascariensis]